MKNNYLNNNQLCYKYNLEPLFWKGQTRDSLLKVIKIIENQDRKIKWYNKLINKIKLWK